MKRDFDCDTCSWFEDGRCTNFNRSAYYPCPEWLRRFDPEKYICDQEWIDTVKDWEKNGRLQNKVYYKSKRLTRRQTLTMKATAFWNKLKNL